MKLLLGKHKLGSRNLYVFSIECLTKQIELVLPTFKSWTVHKVVEYLPLGLLSKKGKGSPYPITECRVLGLIPVLGSQPAGDVSRKPGVRLPLLSARPAVTPATLKRAATSFAAW